MLPLLWTMFPGHPNLLPAFYDPPVTESAVTFKEGDALKVDWVSKPLYGRESVGVLKSTSYNTFEDFLDASYGNYGEAETDEDAFYLGRSIYQVYYPLPIVQGREILLSSWVIGGMPAGINFREIRAG